MRIAFVVGQFPAISETFIINQVADLLDRGNDVRIFSFARGDTENIGEKYFTYRMADKVRYLTPPGDTIKATILAIQKVIALLLLAPKGLFKALTVKRFGQIASPFRLLFWIAPFLRGRFDVFHCHFGPIANQFLTIKEILGLKEKVITSFYGWDISGIYEDKPADYYDRLKNESSLFLVMSDDMKKRAVARGFDAKKIRVLPVSIDVSSYPYRERAYAKGETVKIISVGRFVEKKGFDDLLRALAIVRDRTNTQFECTVVGDGPLKDELVRLTEQLNLKNVVRYKGYMRIEDVIRLLYDAHLFVQPSKTAKNGDME